MPFEPRVKAEILQEMVGQVVTQSALTDLSEGSALLTLLGAVAEGIESAEFRTKGVRDSYDLDNAVGLDLDERVADLPGEGLTRLGRTPASGSVITFTRGTPGAPYVVPAGSLIGRSDSGDLIYATVAAANFGAPDSEVTGVRIICLTAGEAGNCPAGTMDRLINVPDDITAIAQTAAISGGTERESDDQLRSRARLYLSGLARCQTAALRSAALNFVDSNLVRVTHAHVFEDVEQPAYSELVVDDGSGFGGYVVNGLPVTGTIPLNGTSTLFHQFPAAEPITKILVNGSTLLEYPNPDTNPTWVSVPERGVIQLKDGQTDISPSDTWEIGGATTPYNVYVGFIAELQALIEGHGSSPTLNAGYRAAGTRVRVVPPSAYPVNVTVNLILADGVLVTDIVARAEYEIERFFLNLGPGDGFFLSQLYDQLQTSLSPDVKALTILTPTDNFTPGARYSLRAGLITVT